MIKLAAAFGRRDCRLPIVTTQRLVGNISRRKIGWERLHSGYHSY